MKIEYIKQAKAILTQMAKEKIITNFNQDIVDTLRNTLNAVAIKIDLRQAPELTKNVAATFFGIGLCQEVSQRFIFEYARQYQVQNIGLIFLAGIKNTHVLAYIGDLNKVNDPLLIGRGSSSGAINHNSRTDLKEFINRNSNLIYVDPLLNMVATHDSVHTLLAYCQRSEITQVIAIRDFSNTPGLILALPQVERNARQLAQMAQLELRQIHRSAQQTRTLSPKDRVWFAATSCAMFPLMTIPPTANKLNMKALIAFNQEVDDLLSDQNTLPSLKYGMFRNKPFNLDNNTLNNFKNDALETLDEMKSLLSPKT